MKRSIRQLMVVAAALVLPLVAQSDEVTDEAAATVESTNIATQGTLEITITNIENGRGTLYLSLQNSSEHWLETDADTTSFRDITLPVSSTDDLVILVEDLPPGNYAVSLFQDLDGDVELDTNFIGFPKEPFGFSAPMGKFGPPKFEDAAVAFSGDDISMSIALN